MMGYDDDEMGSERELPYALLEDFAHVIGAEWVWTDPERIEPHLHEGRGRWDGHASAVLHPGSTEEVAALVRLCAEAGVPMTPQGGHTGLVGGGVPLGGVVIAMGRMNQIRAIDPLNATMTVEAGCTLLEIQEAAEEAGRLFPLSLASEGSCQIGGNLSTNAGGTAVLRYGNARELVLGIEAVLPSGEVLNSLTGLRKDNTGYALKDLMIGAEGTLGIITAAVLKLYPAPAKRVTAFASFAGPHEALALFDLLRARAGEALVAFEYIDRFGLEIVTRHLPGARDPLEEAMPAYALIELSSPDPEADLETRLETVLEQAFEEGIVADASIASSEAQRKAFWALRESLSEMQKHEGASIKHDVAVPVSRVAEFIERGITACRAHISDIRPCPFGHFGDGNLHFNITRPVGMTNEEFLAEYPALNRIVHDLVHEMEGTISAEHGIGLAKRDELARYKDPVALELCRVIKQAIDPQNLMNPGKMLPPRG